MDTRKILIIDDNGENGVELSMACRRLATDWDVLWLRVIAKEPDPLDEEALGGAAYRVVGNADDAVAAIRGAAGAASCGLIVFYDLQLLGVQSPETAVVTGSPITIMLRSLMNEQGRRMVMPIHSAHGASSFIADSLDASGQRTFSVVVTGKDRAHVEGVVKQALNKWDELYPREAMSAEEFLIAMEGMTHWQIQDYAGFLKDRLTKEPGSPEEELRQKYPAPKEVLRKYLRMGAPEFEENFCDGGKNLTAAVIEALK